MPVAPPRKPRKPRAPKLNASALRELVQTHSKAAVEVLVEVAATGSSEALRIAAAMALLDRGYGKSGAKPASDSRASASILYRIELIDGIAETSSAGDPACGDQVSDGQD